MYRAYVYIGMVICGKSDPENGGPIKLYSKHFMRVFRWVCYRNISVGGGPRTERTRWPPPSLSPYCGRGVRRNHSPSHTPHARAPARSSPRLSRSLTPSPDRRGMWNIYKAHLPHAYILSDSLVLGIGRRAGVVIHRHAQDMILSKISSPSKWVWTPTLVCPKFGQNVDSRGVFCTYVKVWNDIPGTVSRVKTPWTRSLEYSSCLWGHGIGCGWSAWGVPR